MAKQTIRSLLLGGESPEGLSNRGFKRSSVDRVRRSLKGKASSPSPPAGDTELMTQRRLVELEELRRRERLAKLPTQQELSLASLEGRVSDLEHWRNFLMLSLGRLLSLGMSPCLRCGRVGQGVVISCLSCGSVGIVPLVLPQHSPFASRSPVP